MEYVSSGGLNVFPRGVNRRKRRRTQHKEEGTAELYEGELNEGKIT